MKKKSVKVCEECGCNYDTRFLIRLEDFNQEVDQLTGLPKSYLFEANNKRQIVGLLKTCVDNFGFDEITITRLSSFCVFHQGLDKEMLE